MVHRITWGNVEGIGRFNLEPLMLKREYFHSVYLYARGLTECEDSLGRLWT